MTARILPFRPRNHETDPERRSAEMIQALRDADALLEEIRREQIAAMAEHIDRLYTQPTPPGA